MDIETLQKAWHEVKSEPRTDDEYRRMMYASPAWNFKRVSLKQWFNFFLKVLVLAAIIVAFDLFGSWSTGICTGWGIYVFLDDYLGLRYLRALPQKESIQESLDYILTQARKASLVSRLAHIVVWAVVVVVLSQAVPLGDMNTGRWALILSPALLAVYWWSNQRWAARLQEVKDLIDEFTDDQPEPLTDTL